MVYNYIYIISFEERNEIYIGRTNNIKRRFSEHKQTGVVWEYYHKNFESEYIDGDWSKMYIDIIDRVNMDDNLLYLVEDNKKKKKFNSYFYLNSLFKQNEYLMNEKLKYTELFHICYYNSKTKYCLLNKLIPTDNETIFEWYKFYNY